MMKNKIKISEFFTENNGRLSSTRLLMITVLMLLVFDWLHAIYTIGSYVISWEKVALISAVFGLKGAQKMFEGNSIPFDSYDNINYRIERDDRKRNKRTY
jgi:hypothetical protein